MFLAFRRTAKSTYAQAPSYLNIANARSFKHVPAEGELKALDGAPYSAAKALQLAKQPLIGKLKPINRKPKVILLHGHPGSGKTTFGMERLKALDPKGNQLAVCSYDEHGALFAMPEYQKEMASAQTFEQRSAIWAKYRAVSQRIRSATLDMAMEAGCDLYIDTTSSSDHTFKLIQALQTKGYEIEIWSYVAPLDVGLKRVLEKQRGGDLFESVTKRAGAFLTFPKLICGFDDGQTVTRGCDTVRLFMNGIDGTVPQEAATWKNNEGTPTLVLQDRPLINTLYSYLGQPATSRIVENFGWAFGQSQSELAAFAKKAQDRFFTDWTKLTISAVDFRLFVTNNTMPAQSTIRSSYPVKIAL
ncbi:MAG: hypothetical protein EBQ96_06415 [Proteobacteria bacterium]|nr:hypothetical protein [Pseudomonadota bacterium]